MFTPVIDNDGKHVDAILSRTNCEKHGADIGIPCWPVYPGSEHQLGYLAAVCGLRIRRAGFTGKVSPTSLSTSIAGGRSGPRTR